MNQTAELKKYSELVETLARDEDDQLFTNTGAGHASIVLKTIFKYSKYVLNVFTGKLENCKYDSDNGYFEELKKSVRNGVSVRIIFEDQPDGDVLEGLKELKEEGCSLDLRILDQNSDIKKTIGEHHFVTGDHRMFRFEDDKANFKAFCNFNDPFTVEKLTQHFDFLVANSKELFAA